MNNVKSPAVLVAGMSLLTSFAGFFAYFIGANAQANGATVQNNEYMALAGWFGLVFAIGYVVIDRNNAKKSKANGTSEGIPSLEFIALLFLALSLAAQASLLMFVSEGEPNVTLISLASVTIVLGVASWALNSWKSKASPSEAL